MANSNLKRMKSHSPKSEEVIWDTEVKGLGLRKRGADRAFEHHGRHVEFGWVIQPILHALFKMERFSQTISPLSGEPGFCDGKQIFCVPAGLRIATDSDGNVITITNLSGKTVTGSADISRKQLDLCLPPNATISIEGEPQMKTKTPALIPISS